LRENYGEFQMRFGRKFFEALRTKRRWALDEATPFEAVRVLDPAPKQSASAEAQRVLPQKFPAFAGMQVAGSWGGMIDVTPDAVPVIDQVASLPGFYLASGFSGHGFGIGPGAGRLMADIVAGDTPAIDPAPFRFARLAP
jgi:glycine/D-amino acid oxidase-like deaminating enzyme